MNSVEERRSRQNWELPLPLKQVKAAMVSLPDSDKQFVGILPLVLTHTLESVINACAEAVAATTIILNILSRAQKQSTPTDYEIPRLPALKMPPIANCRRYDLLLMGSAHVA